MDQRDFKVTESMLYSAAPIKPTRKAASQSPILPMGNKLIRRESPEGMGKRSMCGWACWEAREKSTLCKIVSVLGKETKGQETTKREGRSGAGYWKKSLVVSPIHTIVLTPCKRL